VASQAISAVHAYQVTRDQHAMGGEPYT
jgi:hypothetical protein